MQVAKYSSHTLYDPEWVLGVNNNQPIMTQRAFKQLFPLLGPPRMRGGRGESGGEGERRGGEGRGGEEREGEGKGEGGGTCDGGLYLLFLPSQQPLLSVAQMFLSPSSWCMRRMWTLQSSGTSVYACT